MTFRKNIQKASKDKDGEVDGRLYMFYMWMLERIDGAIDNVAPPKWQKYGEATLGDSPSPFLEKLLTSDIKRATIPRFLRYQYPGKQDDGRKDIYQQLNLLCACAKKISCAAQDCIDMPSDAHTKAYIEANQELYVLSFLYGGYDPKDVAGLIREEAGKGKKFDAIYHALVERYPSSKWEGCEQKLFSDVRNWARDLRMEMEYGDQGFIKSNEALALLEKQGKTKRQLYDEYKPYFDKNEPIPYKDAPALIKDMVERITGTNEIDMSFSTKAKDTPGKAGNFTPLKMVMEGVNSLLMALAKNFFSDGIMPGW